MFVDHFAQHHTVFESQKGWCSGRGAVWAHTRWCSGRDGGSPRQQSKGSRSDANRLAAQDEVEAARNAGVLVQVNLWHVVKKQACVDGRLGAHELICSVVRSPSLVNAPRFAGGLLGHRLQ